MAIYHRFRFEVVAGSEERLTAELWSLGTLGLELAADPAGPAAGGTARWVTAYFAAPLDPEVAGLDGAAWRRLGGRLDAAEPVATADWMAAYRRQTKPFPVGRHLWIDPGEPHDAPSSVPAGRRLLRLPARQAFGTGSHASTRLAIELIEAMPLAGRRVLDVGTGTGILAFAALLAGAASVVGFDRDPAAALLAAQNRRLNDLEPLLFAGPLAALGPLHGAPPVRRFDVALVNVLPERILDELPALAACLAPLAAAVFSGILLERRESVERALADAGLGVVAARDDDEWIALLTRLASPQRAAEVGP